MAGLIHAQGGPNSDIQVISGIFAAPVIITRSGKLCCSQRAPGFPITPGGGIFKEDKAMFKKIEGDWQNLRNLPGLMEVDLHFGRGRPGEFWENMAEVADIVEKALRDAQKEGFQYVMFSHGHSTSRPGRTTARSIVRAIMRSKEATPFIIKNQSMQHNTVSLRRLGR
jgi:hypothetical protein